MAFARVAPAGQSRDRATGSAKSSTQSSPLVQLQSGFGNQALVRDRNVRAEVLRESFRQSLERRDLVETLYGSIARELAKAFVNRPRERVPPRTMVGAPNVPDEVEDASEDVVYNAIVNA